MTFSSAAPGRLIVLEGPDGAGKTTLVQGLSTALADTHDVEVMSLREPGGTDLGEMIRDILKGHVSIGAEMDDRAEALLFAAARAQLVAQVIRPALQAGKWVLLDRFEGSTMIYQGLGRGLGMQQMHALSRFATCDLQPDVTVVLRISEQTSRARRAVRDGETPDRIEASGDEFMRQIFDGYSRLKEFDASVVEVSAEGTPGEVLAAAVAAIGRQLS
jgi:dTMP kinase